MRADPTKLQRAAGLPLLIQGKSERWAAVSSPRLTRQPPKTGPPPTPAAHFRSARCGGCPIILQRKQLCSPAAVALREDSIAGVRGTIFEVPRHGGVCEYWASDATGVQDEASAWPMSNALPVPTQTPLHATGYLLRNCCRNSCSNCPKQIPHSTAGYRLNQSNKRTC
jgi:hypothetical protein